MTLRHSVGIVASQSRRLATVFSHPLALLIVGATISGYLIPSITRQWQNHAKVLDVKSELARKINEAYSGYYGSLQLIELGGGDPTLRSLDRAYVRWNIDSSAIRGELQAYFPKSESLLSQWEDLRLSMLAIYYVLKNDTPKERRARWHDWSLWLPGRSHYTFNSIIDVSLRHIPKGRSGGYDTDLGVLFQDKFRTREERIVQMVIDAHSAL